MNHCNLELFLFSLTLCKQSEGLKMLQNRFVRMQLSVFHVYNFFEIFTVQIY